MGGKSSSWFRIFDYVDVLLYLFMGSQYLYWWISPDPEKLDYLFFLSVLMGFEFIVVHSGIFMAALPTLWSFLLFIPVYGLFALAFTSIVGDYSILWIYLVIVLNRMRFAFIRIPTAERNQLVGLSALNTIIYFLTLVASVVCSSFIPKLGLSDAFLETHGYENVKRHGGLLLDEPQVAMCLGTFYYAFLFLNDIFIKGLFAYGKKRDKTM